MEIKSITVSTSIDPQGKMMMPNGEYMDWRTEERVIAEAHYGGPLNGQPKGWSEDAARSETARYGSVRAACEHYAKEDHARALHLRARVWRYWVIKVAANVTYAAPGRVATEELAAYVGGVESDAGAGHHRELSVDTAADLRSKLEQKGVPVDNFDVLFAAALAKRFPDDGE
jgi:hypothetical protein